MLRRDFLSKAPLVHQVQGNGIFEIVYAIGDIVRHVHDAAVERFVQRAAMTSRAGLPGDEGSSVGISQGREHPVNDVLDRKSTRLNSSHVKISYAVFCLKKKRYDAR